MGALTGWLSPHPAWEEGEDWPEVVPVVRYETEDEIVVIDPFLPPDDSLDPAGKPVRVLLTQHAHYRGTADFVERYGASVWSLPAAAEELPDGVEALALDADREPLLASLERVAELPIERVIGPRCEEPEFLHGAAHIRAAVAAARASA